MFHQTLLYSSPQHPSSYSPYPPPPYTSHFQQLPPPSMAASSSSSPTLAESEPSLLPDSHFEQSTDGVVKSWLTRVPPPLSPYFDHPTHLDFDQNQHPTPYVPTVIRRRALADPASCGLEQPVWQRHHPWISRFRAGSIILDHTVRRSYAEEIVNSGPWDTSTISELAGKFCDRVAEGLDDPTIHNVALFAREVLDLFRAQLGHTPASFFENQLRQCVLSEFRAWWLHVRTFFLISPFPFILTLSFTATPILSRTDSFQLPFSSPPPCSLPRQLGTLRFNVHRQTLLFWSRLRFFRPFMPSHPCRQPHRHRGVACNIFYHLSRKRDALRAHSHQRSSLCARRQSCPIVRDVLCRPPTPCDGEYKGFSPGSLVLPSFIPGEYLR